MKSMNLRLNLMKWACVVLALAAVACDDKKKTLPGGETTEGERTRTFFPMIMQVDGNISLLRKEIL